MTGESFDRVERALEERDCRPRGNIDRSIQALCPAHGDRNPSLHVTYDPAGEKVLLHCFAGCETADILGALALDDVDLWDTPLGKQRVGTRL